MSNLLPKSSAKEFQLREYWDKFFGRRSSAFEWYGEYLDLQEILHKYLRPSSSVLVAGCGNSKLSEGLYDAGYRRITNIDVSSVVIRQMKEKHKEKREEMKFLKMDVMEMEFADSSFDVVLDKGTLDAIFSSMDDETVEKVRIMFDEIWRVLKVAGRYICITLAQEHILTTFLKSFETGWLLRVHKVVLGGEAESVGGALPVFVFICTKMAQRSRDMKVFEYVTDDGKCVRSEGVGKVEEFVRDAQQYAMIQHHLSKLHVGETCLQMDLWLPDVPSEPRYTFSIVDLPKRKAKNGPFAVFIAPQGREVDWLFSSDDGRLQLAESAAVERLVVVTMHRSHTYSSLDQVKEEVSAKAVELIQSGLPPRRKYPVMTMGEGLGSRVILHEGCSELSGPYVVEECEGDGGTRVRRLVFLNSPSVSQTEMKIVSVKSSKKKKQQKLKMDIAKLDHSHLSCTYLEYMVASFALHPHYLRGDASSFEADLKVLLIGLGGGSLVTFISKYIPNVSVDVVELDPEVVSIAERFFDLMPSEKIQVSVHDGIEFVKNAQLAGKKETYDIVILDVDSKDTGVGMTCPPVQFLEKPFLEACQYVLKPSGMMMLNLAARNKTKRNEALLSLFTIFSSVLVLNISQDINKVVLALPETREKIMAEVVVCGTKKEMLAEGICQLECNLRHDILNSINKFAEKISTTSGNDIKYEMFHSDILSSFSNISILNNS